MPFLLNRTALKFHVISEVVIGVQAGVISLKSETGDGQAPRMYDQIGSANAPFTLMISVSGNDGTKPPPGRTYFRILRISEFAPGSCPANCKFQNAPHGRDEPHMIVCAWCDNVPGCTESQEC
jgi:hypothetical protein